MMLKVSPPRAVFTFLRMFQRTAKARVSSHPRRHADQFRCRLQMKFSGAQHRSLLSRKSSRYNTPSRRCYSKLDADDDKSMAGFAKVLFPPLMQVVKNHKGHRRGDPCGRKYASRIRSLRIPRHRHRRLRRASRRSNR